MSLRAALRDQAKACTQLGSPFTGRLLTLLADRLQPGTPLTDRLFNWPGDIGPRAVSVPLRLAGALHGLVLDGTSPELTATYPPNPAPDDDTLRLAISAALDRHAARINDWLDRPPQTNEVGRSAVLIAVGHWLNHRYHLPLTLSELGASAGLNLNWDRYGLEIHDRTIGPDDPALMLNPKWTGPLPNGPLPQVANRRGTDLTPLNPANADDRLRLLAYIWPDQQHRLTRTRAALNLPAAPVDRSDAADWLENRLQKQSPGHLHLIYHTIAWQYFPPAVQNRAKRLIETAGARATSNAPLAWFGMEADNDTKGAVLTLRLWPGDQGFRMGRADFHGAWVDWQPPRPTQ